MPHISAADKAAAGQEAGAGVEGGEVSGENVWRCSIDHTREPPDSGWVLFKPRHPSIFQYLELRIILGGFLVIFY
jgi:hypothetical protein